MEKKEKNRGITLVALVITIIILLILVAVTINFTLGENGIITKTQLAKFSTEMAAIKEKFNSWKLYYEIDNNMNEFYQELGNQIDKDTSKNWDKTLIVEIAYFKNLYGQLDFLENMSQDKVSEKYFWSYYEKNPDVVLNGVYYIKKEIADGKEKTYIYDSTTDIIYKIPVTKIGLKKVHSIEYYNQKTGAFRKVASEVVEETGKLVTVNSLSYYSPNCRGYTLDDSYIMYYEQDQENYEITGEIEEIKLRDYIANGSQRIITKEEKVYVAYDYEHQIWANIKTKSNGLEAWWVWIPRYAYVIDKTNNTIEINFVDVNSHASPSFTVDGKELQGIWTSKYEVTTATTTTQSIEHEYYLPDINGFNENETYLEIYNKERNEFSEEISIAKAKEKYGSIKKFSQSNLWFDYNNKIWANVKTTSNGLESWWVWVPRYAYCISGDGIDIKFTDIYNNPLDGSELGDYIPHPAFTVDGKELQGIWISKYEVTEANAKVNQDIKLPNLDGFNVNDTYIQIYSNTGDKLLGQIKLKDVVDASKVKDNILQGNSIDKNKLDNEISKISKDGVWYNYNNKIWANIKTTSNGLESWWVWIPRYAYSIIGAGIDIVFTDTSNNAINSNADVSSAMIPHPAFTVDGNELEGIWTSKYEVTGTAVSTSEAAEYSE